MAKPIEMFVRQVLAERGRAARLRDAIAGAWVALERYPDRAWWRRKSTRAAIVWEQAVDNIIEAFRDDLDVKVIRHFDTVSFIFEDAVLLRIKKADIELRSSNYPTSQALLFHEPDVDLFGFAGLQRVEAAYVLNPFETAMDWIGVVARDGDKQIWHFELNEMAEVAAVLPFGESTKGPASDVVRLKNPEERNRGEGQA